MRLRYCEAFARYGAKVRSGQLSLCALAPDGSLVISLSEHKFMRGGRYVDRLSEVSKYRDRAGYLELAERLQEAVTCQRPIRAVIAHSAKPHVDAENASTRHKYFTTSGLVGVVTQFDGDNFIIEFQRAGNDRT